MMDDIDKELLRCEKLIMRCDELILEVKGSGKYIDKYRSEVKE